MRLRPSWLPHPVLSLILLVLWCLLVRSVAPGQLLLGAAFAIGLPWFTRRFWLSAPRVRRMDRLLRLFPVFLWDVLVANVAVAGMILNVRRELRPMWIVIPLRLTDPYAITTLANMISLTPGTVSAKLSPDRRKLLVHMIDVENPEAEVERITRRYETPLKEIFEW